MSFHGGLIGVLVAIAIFAYRRGISVLALSDLIAVVAPIGLFFGRIANFVNGELFGRVTDVPLLNFSASLMLISDLSLARVGAN